MDTSPSLTNLAVALLRGRISKEFGEPAANMLFERTPVPAYAEKMLEAFAVADTAAAQDSDDDILRSMVRDLPVSRPEGLEKLAKIGPLPLSLDHDSLLRLLLELFSQNFRRSSTVELQRTANQYCNYLEQALDDTFADIAPQIIEELNTLQSSSTQKVLNEISEVVQQILPEDQQKKRKAKLKPVPPTPAEQTSMVLPDNGVRLSVALIPSGWRLDGMDGLVIRVDSEGIVPVGEFYQAFLEDMPRNSRKEIDDEIVGAIERQGTSRNRRRKTVLYNTFLPVKLSPRLQEHVFPFSPNKAGVIVLTNDHRGQGERTLDDSVMAMVGAIARAATNGVKHVVVPLLGTARLPEDQRADVLERVIKRLKALTYSEPRTLQQITIVTTSSVVVTRGRQIFNLLRNNRAQAFRNDQALGKDLLGISEEINALADTLLLREVQPPIAVGIMGGWGSGKSFVMHLIQQRMGEIRSYSIGKAGAGNTEDEPNPSPFVGHVYQISFNAWTYAKSSLWASLMQTIFFELNRQISIEQKFAKEELLAAGSAFQALQDGSIAVKDNPLWAILRERKNQELESLHQSELELSEEKIRNEEAIAAKQKEVEQILGEQVPSAAVSLLKQKVEAVARDAISQSAKTVLASTASVKHSDIEKVVESLRSTGATLKNLAKEIKRHPVAAICLVVFAGISFWGIPFLARVFEWQVYRDWMRWLVSFVPVLLPALDIISSWSRRIDEILKEYQTLAETERANWQSQKDSLLAEKKTLDEKTLAEELKRAGSDEEKTKTLKRLATNQNLAASERLVKEKEVQVEDQRRRIGPTAQYVSLLEFVHSRLDEAGYESQLGLMHQVKRDIDELNAGLVIREWDNDTEKEIKRKLFPRGEPRIVLFIDDLDRCPPPRVVEVLEAVQLLLHTELFVVIVGLDTRYVTRALEKEYKEILQHEGDPSGLDYIEKIIQIPYRVRPIQETGLRNYLQAQMDILPASTPVPAEIPPPAKPSGGRKRVTRPEPVPEPQDTETAPPSAEQVQAAAPSQPTDAVVDLPPEVVKFQKEDLDDLATCCKQMDLTPRSVKRLVNVFKLIEIFWFRASGESRSRGVKEAVMGLLALSAAYPEIMREVFVRMDLLLQDEKSQSKLVFDTLAEFRPKHTEVQLSSLKWPFFQRDVSALKSRRFGKVSLRQLELSTFNLVRSFSFVGDPSYWEDRTPLKSTSRM